MTRETDDILTAITPVLTSGSCLWMFYKYFSQFHINKKNTGFSLIIILILSDFIFSLNLLFFIINPSFMGAFMSFAVALYFFTLYFSVIWASAISFLVYKTLQNMNYDSRQRLAKTLLLVFVVCFVLTI